MAITTRSTINNSGESLQTWLNREVIENLEPNLYLYEMGQKPMFPDGYNTLAFVKPVKLEVTATDAELTEGVTPDEKSYKLDTISVTTKQYGFYITISDILNEVTAIKLIPKTANSVGKNMARIIDDVIQTELLNGTNVIYANNKTQRNNLAVGDVMKGTDLALLATHLEANEAEPIGDGYVAIMHSLVYHGLKLDDKAGGFIEASKYNTPDKIFKGEIGMLWGIRVIKCNNIKAVKKSPDVYPTFVFGEDAYGVAELQNLITYITGGKASDSDPLAQRYKVGAKVAFGVEILQEEALYRFESVSALA